MSITYDIHDSYQYACTNGFRKLVIETTIQISATVRCFGVQVTPEEAKLN